MTINDLEYYIKLVETQGQGLRGLAPVLKSSTVGKKVTNFSCYREIIHESESADAANFIALSVATAAPLFNHHTLTSQELPI